MDQNILEELRSRKKARKKRWKRIQIVSGVLIFAGLILVISFFFWGRHGPYPWNMDSNATTQKPITQAEMQAQLQKAADESRFRFKMNTSPTVVWSMSSRSETESMAETMIEATTASDDEVQMADWYIVNSVENPWAMEVVITSSQDGSEWYRSARLKPGEREMNGPLEVTLEPGTYEAVATATAIDPKTGETAGTVSADLTLTVTAKQ